MKQSETQTSLGVDDEAIETLVTIRDWWRYGASRFAEAGLAFGHGTTNAADEAACLILHALHLPIDVLEPWLDARLTGAERKRIASLFGQRLSTRKPAPYLTNEAWMHGLRFYVDERVIVPRSHIGELLRDRLAAFILDPDAVRSALDLCTGSGCLAILAAHAFPNAVIDASDVSLDALEVAKRNVEDHGLSARVRLLESDLFDGVRGGPYDLIVSNPPYVSDGSLAAFPAEFQHEPRLAHSGGEDGLALVRKILADAKRHLNRDGFLVVEAGAAGASLEAEYPGLPFLWLETENSEGEVFALPASALELT